MILTDPATLSSGFNPTGTIVFQLFQNGGSTPVFTEAVPVNGNGTYVTPTGFQLPTSQTAVVFYQWVASYSGDANNSSVMGGNPAAEQTVVSPASPPEADL